jgi:hypothetical protein
VLSHTQPLSPQQQPFPREYRYLVPPAARGGQQPSTRRYEQPPPLSPTFADIPYYPSVVPSSLQELEQNIDVADLVASSSGSYSPPMWATGAYYSPYMEESPDVRDRPAVRQADPLIGGLIDSRPNDQDQNGGIARVNKISIGRPLPPPREEVVRRRLPQVKRLRVVHDDEDEDDDEQDVKLVQYCQAAQEPDNQLAEMALAWFLFLLTGLILSQLWSTCWAWLGQLW